MSRSVIWCCRADQRQHLATLSGNPDQGYELRAICGKTAKDVHLPDLLTTGEVTCPACRTEETLAALAKQTAA